MRTLALALIVAAGPAFADSSLPPAEFDLGGQTVEEVMTAYEEYFGEPLPVTAVAYGEALTVCERYLGRPYPAAQIGPGETLVGCLIRNVGDNGPKMVVYTDDPTRPEMAPRLLRHEIGHILGWPRDHARDGSVESFRTLLWGVFGL